MNIVVTGYRHWLVERTVFEVLDNWAGDGRYHRIGTGDCPTGVDSVTYWWCQRQPKVTHVVYYANWDSYGTKAGPMRNKFMIDMEEPELVLAFLHPRSKGTVQCMQYARSKGIRVLEIWEGR